MSDSYGVHTDACDGNSDEVVSDEAGNPADTSRSGAHGEKRSMFTSGWRNLSHFDIWDDIKLAQFVRARDC